MHLQIASSCWRVDKRSRRKIYDRSHTCGSRQKFQCLQKLCLCVCPELLYFCQCIYLYNCLYPCKKEQVCISAYPKNPIKRVQMNEIKDEIKDLTSLLARTWSSPSFLIAVPQEHQLLQNLDSQVCPDVRKTALFVSTLVW